MTEDQFKDYYESLQLSPNADQETIERVFRLLAKRYHPDNGETGDAERFNSLFEAYRVLSVADKRAAYDAGYEQVKAFKSKVLAEASLVGSLEDSKTIRHGILSALYIARRRNARNPGLGIFYLEQILESIQEQLEFHIWYLKEKGWIERTDSGTFAITADGVDVIEEKELVFGKERPLLEYVSAAKK